MFGLNKTKIAPYFLDFFGIQKLFRIVYFFDKKFTKKLIGLVPLVNFLNQALTGGKLFFFCLVNSYVVELLACLKSVGFLFDFLIIPPSLFKACVLFGDKVLLDHSVALVYLVKNLDTLNHISRIKLFSKPSRQVYLSYIALKKLCHLTKCGQRMFVLTTAFGVVTHTELLSKRFGGTLLFIV